MRKSPLPPDCNTLLWRTLESVDLSAIVILSTDCLQADGGLPLAATDWYARSRYLAEGPSNVSIGAFSESGLLVACAALQMTGTGGELRANCSGQVHPDWRNRGYGAFMLEWGEAQARALAAEYPRIETVTLVLTSEWLSPGGVELYMDHGYSRIFAEDVLRYDLGRGLPEYPLSEECELVTWSADRASLFFDVYDEAFRERPGYPGWSAQEWIAWVADDDDFLPDLSFLAVYKGRPVGYVVSSEDWIVQVGVRPARRRLGIATSLIARVLQGMAARGGREVLLAVNVNNPTATRVYVDMGFEIVGRRARFARELGGRVE